MEGYGGVGLGLDAATAEYSRLFVRSVSLCRVRAAVVEGRPARAYRLLSAACRRERTCYRHRMLRFQRVHLWLRKYLTWSERPLLVDCVYIQEAKPDLCDRSDCKVLSFFCAIVFEGICKLSWFEVFSGARISATAKASKSTVGWTPTSPLLRWAKSEPLPMQM